MVRMMVFLTAALVAQLQVEPRLTGNLTAPEEQPAIGRLVEVASYPDPDAPVKDFLLNRPTGIVALPNRMLAVADQGEECLFILNRDSGIIVQKIGRSGQGPGEFTTLFRVAFDQTSNTIWGIDRIGPKCFSYPGGDFKGSFAKFAASSEISVADGQVFLAKTSLADDTIALHFDSEGELLQEMGAHLDLESVATSGKALSRLGLLTVPVGGTDPVLFFFYKYFNEFVRIAGGSQSVLSIPDEQVGEISKANFEKARDWSSDAPPLILFSSAKAYNGMVYVYALVSLNERYVFVLSADGRLKSKFRLTDTEHMYSDFTVFQDETRLRLAFLSVWPVPLVQEFEVERMDF